MPDKQVAPRAPSSWLAIIGPGLLLAATGVGSGDLATASIVGSLLGTSVIWAVLAGAFLKFVITEGLARWQLGSRKTLLEGAVQHLGKIVVWLFLPYLLLWSFFVASAQMSASGITLHAMLPVFDDARSGKIVFGILAGLSGWLLVLRGGYRWFQIAMRVCIGSMFATVVLTAWLLSPDWSQLASDMFAARPAGFDREAIVWTVALMGGIGGTLTVLCYGYWLREEGRTSPEHLTTCRIDLGFSYLMAGIFGIAMVIIGATIEVRGEGTQLLVQLSDRLASEVGELGRWIFLIGTFGTVFSSLLGVWQAVPYLFADCWRLLAGQERASDLQTIDVSSRAYRGYLLALTLIPMAGLFTSFREVQKIYTVLGALFFPLLALALLIFNSRWIPASCRNRPLTNVALLGVLILFAWMGLAGIKTT